MSQKRAGIEALKELMSYNTFGGVELTTLHVQKWHPSSSHLHYFRYPLYARPCPATPRHGFVESRVVHNEEELEQVWKETTEADPYGEVVVCAFINADSNAVWTPRQLVIGKGHDGATGGRPLFTFPLFPPTEEWHRIAEARQPAQLGSDTDPYIEAVSAGRNVTLTQLRSGPKVERGRDYIPFPRTVSTILKVDPTMSLLLWEELILSVKDDPGVVVWHPGGSMVDHFAVHARSAGIPILTTFEPTLGQVLEPIPTTPLTPTSVMRGIGVMDRWEMTNVIDDGGALTAFLIAALHNSTAAEGDEGIWLGMGVAALLRLGSLAIQGEARHLEANKPTREACYAAAMNTRLHQWRRKIPVYGNKLRYGQFSSSAIGGVKWAACASAIIDLFNAVGQFARKMDQESLGKLVRRYNIALNQAHNNGWWLNKFVSPGLFTAIPMGDPIPILQLTPYLVKWWEAVQQVEDVEEVRKAYAQWRSLGFRPPSITKVVVEPLYVGDNICLRVQDRVVGSNGRVIVATLPSGVVAELVTKYLVVKNTPTGRELWHEGPGGPTFIWKEKPL